MKPKLLFLVEVPLFRVTDNDDTCLKTSLGPSLVVFVGTFVDDGGDVIESAVAAGS